MKLNVFVKLHEQKTNLFGLCHSEKTTNEIERFCQAIGAELKKLPGEMSGQFYVTYKKSDI